MRQIVTKYQPPGVINKPGEIFVDETTGQIKIGDGSTSDGLLVGAAASTKKYEIGGSNVPVTGTGSFSASSYARTKSALTAVKNGSSNMKVLCIGDSTTAGAYSLGTAIPWAGNRAVATPAAMSHALNSLEYPSYHASFMGDQNTAESGVSVNVYDPRITLGAGWGINNSASVKTLGGCPFTNSTTINPLSFLPHEEVDTFDVYYMVNTGLGTFNLTRVGDTNSATIDTSGPASGVGMVRFTGALGGTSALNINRVTGGVFIIGVIAFNSTKKAIQVINGGWSGATSANWNSSIAGFSYKPTAIAIQPNLTIISAGVNEWVTGRTPAQFQADLSQLVSSLLPISDVILRTGYPSAKSRASLAVQKTHIDVIYSVAQQHNLIVQDYWQKLGTQEQCFAGKLYADDLHPLKELLQKTGEIDANLILRLA